MRRGGIPGSSGTVRPLRRFGDPVLRGAAEPVTDFDGRLGRLVEDLYATMYAAGGVGLAAPQIGVPQRVFVFDCPDDEERRHLGHLVNPRLVAADGIRMSGPEGCLSLRGKEASIPRFDRAVVEGVDLTGAPVVVEGTGFFARCLQHECDHLEGVLYTDHLRGPADWRVVRALCGLPPRGV